MVFRMAQGERGGLRAAVIFNNGQYEGPSIMNLFIRLLWVSIVARFRAPCEPLGACITRFSVWPTDLDVLRHMNNGRYFSIMDLGRVDLLIRSGMLRLIRQAGYWPVIAAETIRFRRSLKLFERFDVETRVIGWDEKAFLMQQRFLRRNKRSGVVDVLAEGVVRARFVSKQGTVPAADFLALLGQQDTLSPELPEWVAQWNNVQAALRPVGADELALTAAS